MTLADQSAMSGHDGRVTEGQPARPKRRTFTAAYKARILAAFDALPEGSPGRGGLAAEVPAQLGGKPPDPGPRPLPAQVLAEPGQVGLAETAGSGGRLVPVRVDERRRAHLAQHRPHSLRDRYPDVAWRQIRAFRNLAVHRYFAVDWAVVRQICQEEAPILERRAMITVRADSRSWQRSAIKSPDRNRLQSSSRHRARRTLAERIRSVCD